MRRAQPVHQGAGDRRLSRSTRQSALVIRRARPEDAEGLRAVEAATWSVDVSPAPARVPDRPVFDAGRRPADTLVAWVGDRLVGFVTLGAPSPLESERHVLEVHGFGVDPGHRRRGVGRGLVEAARAEAAARGARRLTLRVLGPNTSAQALYRDAGFVVEGVLRQEFHLGGGYVDDVLMALDLV